MHTMKALILVALVATLSVVTSADNPTNSNPPTVVTPTSSMPAASANTTAGTLVPPKELPSSHPAGHDANQQAAPSVPSAGISGTMVTAIVVLVVLAVSILGFVIYRYKSRGGM